VIGDAGMAFLAQAIRDKGLRELDISLNEIGPVGFSALCDVLPSTKLTQLTCNKNFLGDDSMEKFSQILHQLRLKKFDFSSCRLGD